MLMRKNFFGQGVFLEKFISFFGFTFQKAQMSAWLWMMVLVSARLGIFLFR